MMTNSRCYRGCDSWDCYFLYDNLLLFSFPLFVIDLCEGIQQKRLRYKDTVNMANFKAILLSDRSEFVMKEHKNDKCLCGTVRLQEGRKGAEKNIGL